MRGLIVIVIAAACSSGQVAEGGPALGSAATAPVGRRIALAGGLHRSVCAVTSDDRLRCWGERKASPVEVADAPHHIVQLAGQRAVLADGHVWRWASGSWDATPATSVRALAEDPQFDVRYALLADGTVRAQGDRQRFPTAPAGDGDVDLPVAGLADAVEIVAGDWQVGTSDWHPYGCARKRGGSVHCWEPDLVAREIGVDAAQIVAGGSDSVCALDRARRVRCWWRPSRGMKVELLEIPELAGSAQIVGQDNADRGFLGAAGRVCGIDDAGAVACALLISEVFKSPHVERAVHVAIPPVARLAFAGNVGLAVLRDGGLMAWGPNDVGQLGDGTLTDRGAPVRVVHVLDDALPPAATGFGKEQQSEVVMDWSDLPARCKRPVVVGGVAVTSAYAFYNGQALNLWLASYRLDPRSPDADPRGEQKLARFTIQRFSARWEPLAIGPGAYLATDVGTGTGRSFGARQYDGQDPQTFHPVALAGWGDRLQLTVVDDRWVCGTLFAGKVSTPIAARRIPR